MNYKLKKDEYLSSKKYVWRGGVCLGHIFSEVKDRQNIDWQKYREDKTLQMKVVANMTASRTQLMQLKKNSIKCLQI